MNLRQKAKRFKKLYEEGLPKKPYPVVHQTMLPRHYRAQLAVDMCDVNEMQTDPELLRIYIENKMLEELRPIIRDNIKTEENRYTNKYICSLDIWMKGEQV